MSPLGLSPTGPLPRFNGLLYKAEQHKNRHQPRVKAIIQDFSQITTPDGARPLYTDGTILFQSLSGQLHLLEQDNPAVAELTEACRRAGSFENQQLPANHRQLIRAVWRDIKALFSSGMFPVTVQEDERGERLYEKLMESSFKRHQHPLEALLTSALGYDYSADAPTIFSFNGNHPKVAPMATLSA